jgi:hypothetical protein
MLHYEQESACSATKKKRFDMNDAVKHLRFRFASAQRLLQFLGHEWLIIFGNHFLQPSPQQESLDAHIRKNTNFMPPRSTLLNNLCRPESTLSEHVRIF